MATRQTLSEQDYYDYDQMILKKTREISHEYSPGSKEWSLIQNELREECSPRLFVLSKNCCVR